MGKPNDFADRVRKFIRDGSPTPTKLKENIDHGTGDRYQDFQVLLARREGLRDELLSMGDAKLVASFKRLMKQVVAENVPDAAVRAQVRRHIRHALESLTQQASLFDGATWNEPIVPWPPEIIVGGKLNSAAIKAAVARVIHPASGGEHRPRFDKQGIFGVIWDHYLGAAFRPPEHHTGKRPPAFQTPGFMAGRPVEVDEIVRRNRDAKKYLTGIQQRVSPEHWKVFMHLLHGYSDKEAPQALGISRATFFRRQKELLPHLRTLTFQTWLAVLQQLPGYANILKLVAEPERK